MTVEYEVKLYFDISGLGVFTDFTRINSVCRMLGDGKDAVDIRRGRTNGNGRIPPARVELKYIDDAAYLNDENGESPYYRQLTEYTPMIITVDGQIRVYAELAAIKVDRIEEGHTILSIEGAGIKRRLGHGIWAKPLRSPAYRALTATENDDNRVFYAPFEENNGATEFEVYNNLGSVTATGSITYGQYTSAPSSERMLTFGTAGQLVITVPEYSGSEHKVCNLWTTPSTSLAAGTCLMRLNCTGGNIDYIDLEYGVTVDGTLRFMAYKNGALVDDANFVNWSGHIINRHFFISLEFTQNGANLDTRVLIANSTDELINDDPLTGVTIGRITSIIVAQEDCSGASFGHLIVGNETTAFANYISSIGTSGTPVLGMRGFIGEPADDRIIRLCAEEGVTLTVISSNQFGAGDGVALGPQQAKPFLELLELAGETDGGMLYENPEVGGLIYRTARSMHNQAPQITTTYAMLVPPLLPTRDDQGKQNDVTIKNSNGSSRRYTIPDGDFLHYSTEPPPDGMNVVPGGTELSLAVDSDADLQAAWRAHQGSWRGVRVPSIKYNLTKAVISADTELLSDFAFLEPGHTILQGTTGASKWLPPGNMIGLVQGYHERVAQLGREMALSVTPGDAWEVKMPDASASILANNIDENDVELFVDPDPLGPEWTEEDIFYAQIAGDVFKVDISVTETPAFINSGAIASANNGPVTPALPAGITVNQGESLFIWATIRNSGTGTPDDEADWETIVDFGNTKLYHRYYVTGVTAPQITFTGGVAGADCLARMFAFSGVSRSLASGTKQVPAAATLLNSSAANVAYPALTLARDGTAMMFLWKQDDSTGYTPPGSMTEMADNSSTAGDDASIAAYYQLTASEFSAGSVTVGGGAAAISRAVVLAFRPLQSFIVERNILGNAVSHSAGAEIHVWRQGVTGL